MPPGGGGEPGRPEPGRGGQARQPPQRRQRLDGDRHAVHPPGARGNHPLPRPAPVGSCHARPDGVQLAPPPWRHLHVLPAPSLTPDGVDHQPGVLDARAGEPAHGARRPAATRVSTLGQQRRRALGPARGRRSRWSVSRPGGEPGGGRTPAASGSTRSCAGGPTATPQDATAASIAASTWCVRNPRARPGRGGRPAWRRSPRPSRGRSWVRRRLPIHSSSPMRAPARASQGMRTNVRVRCDSKAVGPTAARLVPAVSSTPLRTHVRLCHTDRRAIHPTRPYHRHRRAPRPVGHPPPAGAVAPVGIGRRGGARPRGAARYRPGDGPPGGGRQAPRTQGGGGRAGAVRRPRPRPDPGHAPHDVRGPGRGGPSRAVGLHAPRSQRSSDVAWSPTSSRGA